MDKKSLLSFDGKVRHYYKASLSESEIMTILIVFQFGSFRNFKHYYLFFIRQHLKADFPNAVSYNRFVELESRVFFQMMFFLNLSAFGRCTGISFVDSTMVPVCHNLRRYANKVFKGLASDGKGTMGWCHGFKLHLVCNDRGEIITFCFTGANVDDRDPKVWAVLARRLYGKLFADRGYISPKLFDMLFEDGVHLVTGIRTNMKNKLMPSPHKLVYSFTCLLVYLFTRLLVNSFTCQLKKRFFFIHSICPYSVLSEVQCSLMGVMSASFLHFRVFQTA